MTLRTWRIGSSERIWAMAIALMSAVFLIALLLTSKWLDTNEVAISSTPEPMQATPSVKIDTKQVSKKNELTLPTSTTSKPPVSIIKSAPQPVIISANKQHITNTNSKPQSLPSTQLKHGYFVQVGAFRDQQHALTLQARLIAKKIPVDITNKKGFYAVSAGPYTTDTAAKNAKQSLATSHHLEGFVTHR